MNGDGIQVNEEQEKLFLYPDNIGYVGLVDSMGDEKKIVNAARVSFGKQNDEPLNTKDVVLIKYLIDNLHTSPFEHISFTFICKVPLFVARQHMRHRMASYSEISRRYTSENIEFYLPNKFRKQHEKDKQASTEELFNPEVGDYVYFDGAKELNEMERLAGPQCMFMCRPCEDEDLNELVKGHTQLSFDIYNMMIEKGVCREQARMILPQNMYTTYYVTVNLHNLMHFIGLRYSTHSQWEIRVLAEKMIELIRPMFPETVKAFGY